MNSIETSDLDLGDIFKINDQFHNSALLHFAVEAKVFDELKSPTSSKNIADRKKWDLRKTEITLNALCSLGIIHKHENGFKNAPSTQKYLLSTSKDYVGAIVDHQRLQWSLWNNISEILSASDSLNVQQELRLEKDHKANIAFNNAMIQLSKDNLMDMLTVPDFNGQKRVIDICGGHGTYLSKLASANPELVGEVWDLSTTEEIANETFEKFCVSDRLTFRTTDLRDENWANQPPADICLLNDCLHYFSEPEIKSIVKEVSKNLLPKGTLIILTMRLDNTGTLPTSAAGFSFHMMLNTKNGGLHPTPVIVDSMEEAGFEVEERLIGELQRYVMLIGRK